MKRGGGIEKYGSKKEGFIFYGQLDTKEAMGANMLNTILRSTYQHRITTCGEKHMGHSIKPATNSVVTAMRSLQESWIRELLKVKMCDRSNRFSK